MGTTGPIFEPGWLGQFKKGITESRHEVAEHGLERWMFNMNSSFQTQTPYYAVHARLRKFPHQDIVDDQQIVYGYWLEGIGSRNFPVTRFKGYRAMGRAFGLVKAHAVDIFTRAMGRHVRGMS
jgi:hypothetical protein